MGETTVDISLKFYIDFVSVVGMGTVSILKAYKYLFVFCFSGPLVTTVGPTDVLVGMYL